MAPQWDRPGAWAGPELVTEGTNRVGFSLLGSVAAPWALPSERCFMGFGATFVCVGTVGFLY